MTQLCTSSPENLKSVTVEEDLSDQRLFSVNEEVYKAFIEAVDAPPVENKELKKLLNEKAPWDE